LNQFDIIIVKFIQVTSNVTAKAKLRVGKIELKNTFLVQIVNSGLARSNLVIIFLFEEIDLQIIRQRMPKQRSMLISSYNFFNRYSYQDIRSILFNDFENKLIKSTALCRSLRKSKRGKDFDSEKAGYQH